MESYIFIFDTNKLISAILRPSSVPAQSFRKGLLLGDVVCSDHCPMIIKAQKLILSLKTYMVSIY